MNTFFDTLECLLGVGCIVVAFIYLVNHTAGTEALKILGIAAAIAFLALPLVIQALREMNAPTAALVIAATSITAYAIREHRKPRKAPAQRPPGGERKPLMPRTPERSDERGEAGESHDEMGS